jgi:hypothetical protein
MAWRRLIQLDQCAEGGACFVSRDGVELAVYRPAAAQPAGGNPDSVRAETRCDGIGGASKDAADPPVFVTPNGCPHASGNLSAGTLCGAVITCPWHAWEFDLSTGRCVHNDAVTLMRYPCRVVDGWIEADLGAAIE